MRIALVAGEASGDHLGAALLAGLRRQCPNLDAFGVAGAEMQSQGCRSLFPMSEIAVMGPIAILQQLRHIRRRLLDTVEAIVEAAPDVLVIIDCPEFSHRVASRVRRRRPDLPIIDYVAPSVWAWRPGRAKRMRRYVDEVLAILPFEPDVFARLGGPTCHYVGHPAVEREAPEIAVIDDVRARIGAAGTGVAGRPVLAVMPGSRHSEISRLCAPFAAALSLLAASDEPPTIVVPTLPHLRATIESEVGRWPIRPLVVIEPDERQAAMQIADAAIVASGTATLELALARTPMVVGYRTEWIAALARPLVLRVPSIVLANLIHGGTPIVELFQGDCTGPRLAAEVAPLLRDSVERRAQLAALDLIIAKVKGDGSRPSDHAARIVLKAAASRRRDRS